MNKTYDAIVVGARCGGSPVAMLLARNGYRVLLLDRSDFPSDTVSTHVVQPLGVAALERWGLLARLISTGCPPIHTHSFDFGALAISGTPGPADSPVSYCPRRTVLDKLLLDAAAEAGVEIREGFTVDEILSEHGHVVGIRGHERNGTAVREKARIVIGADGVRSIVADAVGAERYWEKPRLLDNYYAYWSDLPMHGRFDVYVRPNRGFGVMPTHDGLTVIVVGWPYAEAAANRKDIEGNYLRTLDLAPEFAARVRQARRETPFSAGVVPNFFRKPYGPGWALVGDAGYAKDPVTAQGIMNAFLDAERCASALDEVFSECRAFDEAMAHYQRSRDMQFQPTYEHTCQIASLQPPPPEMQHLLGAIHGNRKAMDGFVQMNAGTISPPQFFSSLT
jgi:flavin-dependent dehydrogenase